MSRKLRIEYPGAMYQVMSRWDQPEDIFRDDQDCKKFLTTLGEVCVKTGWQVHAHTCIGIAA
jgi:putative transposase